MDKNELMAYVAGVLTTALDTEPELFPETSAYLACGGEMHKWETVRNVLIHAKFVTIKGNCIQLTDNGREIARKCNEAIAKKG